MDGHHWNISQVCCILLSILVYLSRILTCLTCRIDPLTVDPVLLDIAGEWPFDSQSSTSPPTTPDISAVPVAATVYDGTTWLPTGGKFGVCFSLVFLASFFLFLFS